MSAHSFSTLSRFLLLFLLVVLLAGCQENFYTGLEENDANEILAVLRNHGLKLNKEPGEKKTWNLTIEKSQLPQAMALLAKNGLPRDRFENMGQIFKKEGLISSPLEEKARFTYALSQELSETITLIDGVLAARVHVVPQELDVMGEKISPASASIFIKYGSDVDMQDKVLRIKKMVERSITGLKYDEISIFLFPADEKPSVFPAPLPTVLGIKVAPGSAGVVWAILLAFLITFFIACYLSWNFFRYQKQKQEKIENE